MRLVELIPVEILRTKAGRLNSEHSGLLAGLADPVVARALSALHKNAAHAWTVAALAKLCGASRSTLATRIRKVMGTGPIEYLAKDELRRGTRSIGEIAAAVGFHSASAFSTSFTRAVGCSPKRFGNSVGQIPDRTVASVSLSPALANPACWLREFTDQRTPCSTAPMTSNRASRS